MLFLAWGAFFKHITPINIVLILLATLLLVAAAKIEERENISFFGAAYTDYMRRSRMFIPWVF